ncbi:MAG: CCA tRNA nucleotidyltransferase [Chlamydiales bacterium]|nr:CCA tRNA nucleotidyltransferase [Chlamydiales bacterium]
MSHIEKLATEIVTKLKANGYIAYFAGGFVRDKILGLSSSDIDVATNALPDEVAAIFPEHFLVGAQFGVCVVRHKHHSFEVATFRQDEDYHDGRRPSTVTLRSTPEEDAKRRDFTVNGMFYDPSTDEIIDFVGGKEDLKKNVIRTIGKAEERFTEDRLRMIRAIRFAYRLGFHIEKETKEAIKSLSHTLLPSVSMERIWQEIQKIRQGPNFHLALTDLHELGLLGCALPPLQKLSSKHIVERLQGLDQVSVKVPAILILAELFNPEDIAFVLGLGITMRASKEETKWIETLIEVKALWQQDPGFTRRFDWAQGLANHRSHACLEVIFAKLSDDDKQKSFSLLDDTIKSLGAHIERLHKKQPLCQAKDLAELGVKPGKKMGLLLETASRLSVDYDLQTRDEVLKKLLQDPIWNDS